MTVRTLPVRLRGAREGPWNTRGGATCVFGDSGGAIWFGNTVVGELVMVVSRVKEGRTGDGEDVPR